MEEVRHTLFCEEKENHFEDYGLLVRNCVYYGKSPTFRRNIASCLGPLPASFCWFLARLALRLCTWTIYSSETSGCSRTAWVILLEGSQASFACPSDKGTVKVKMLGWLGAVAWGRGRRIWFSEILGLVSQSLSKLYIKLQFLLHRKHTASVLQRPASYYWVTCSFIN
jgi:hypothetical protein